MPIFPHDVPGALVHVTGTCATWTWTVLAEDVETLRRLL